MSRRKDHAAEFDREGSTNLAPITRIPEDRLAAYRTAVFVVPEGGEAHRITRDAHDCGIVTAFNPGRTLTDEENEARHRHLLAEVERRGLRHGEMFGASPDEVHRERSLLIAADEVIIRALGAMFDQEAVFVVRRGDVYLQTCSEPAQGERLDGLSSRLRLTPQDLAPPGGRRPSDSKGGTP